MSPTRLTSRSMRSGLVSGLLALSIALGAGFVPGALAKPEATDVKGEQTTANPEQPAPVSTTTEDIPDELPVDGNSLKVSPKSYVKEAAPTSEAVTDAKATADKSETDFRTSGQIEEENKEKNQLQYDEAVKHYYLAHFYQDKWDLNLAATEYEQAISFEPDLKIAHRDLCWVSLLSGNIPRAVAEFMMVVGLGEPTGYTPEEKLDLNHKALALHYKKGLEYARAADWKNAQNEMNWALSYDRDDWAVHRSLAFIFASEGDYKKAAEEYEDALALTPADPSATRADLAYVLFDAGEKQAAQEQLAEAVRTSPNAAAFHVDLGFVAETRGDYATATAELRKALELKPKHAGLWTRLGHLLEKEGKPTEAEAAYNMAINLDATAIDDLKDDLERLKKNPS